MSSQGDQPEGETGQSSSERQPQKEEQKPQQQQQQPQKEEQKPQQQQQQPQKEEQKQEEPKEEIPPKEKGIVDKIREKFGDKVELAYAKPNRIRFDTNPEIVKEFAEFLRDEIGFDHPISVSGTDYPKENVIEVIYHFGCCVNPDYRAGVFALGLKLPRDNPKTPTLIPVYMGVEYHERETFEMLGVIFEGHPKLQRLFLPEDWADIPPLRKDFQIKGR